MPNESRTALHIASLFDAGVLRRLAVSESGFIFDPVTGNSFTANDSALVLIKLLQVEMKIEEAVSVLTSRFEVESREAERDIRDFVAVLAKHFN